MKLRGALQVVCTTLLMSISGIPVASSATRSIVLLFDERPELPGWHGSMLSSWRNSRPTPPSLSSFSGRRWI